ncbi:hypothetical protein B0J13DRAFT_96113 [Dactylonectria estremocensis]|uniref:Uncharacterized protein n=1 Tax=Dactylonectria estremocensis TaxID=1079267 RepID=A0A9P9IWF4_9HYPO|nr:hypothetical protein B0J13DRAFT_96113 [Dactylonectria estremocensis]
MRCTAVEGGMRCNMNVSGGSSTAHNFCTELHLCTFPSCENARVRQDGQDLLFCHDHRCDHGGCRNLKEAGPFCKSHTCEESHCASFVPGGDFGDPERFCERHRRCLKAYCSRFCHVRENGLPSPFCGAHYCEFSDCGNEREAAAHCPDHTCGEPGCIKGRDSVTGLYCKDHECKTKGCRMKRLGRDYCPYHRCVSDGCEAEVDENRYCERHNKRPEGERERECERLRQTLGGPMFATCGDGKLSYRLTSPRALLTSQEIIVGIVPALATGWGVVGLSNEAPYIANTTSAKSENAAILEHPRSSTAVITVALSRVATE